MFHIYRRATGMIFLPRLLEMALCIFFNLLKNKYKFYWLGQ